MKSSVTTILMIAGALAAGGASAYFADGYIDRTVAARRGELDAQYQPVRVVVANAELRPGTFLSSQSVAVREIPRAFLHSDAVLAESWSSIANRVVALSLKSGEPVLKSHLAQDVRAGFSSQLAHGTRALTFPVDDQASMAGMLAPGDHIDIFFTTTSNNESITQPLLLNVPVIATGIRTVANAGYLEERRHGAPYTTVTVSVAPEEAARITLALDAGKITIALRQPHDDNLVRIARITKRTLLEGERLVKTVRRPRAEVILGGVTQ